MELNTLYHEIWEDLIPFAFVDYVDYYYSELVDVPLPSSYPLWNKKFLEEKLKKVDLYINDIINDAKELLKLLVKKEKLLLNYNQ